MNPVPGEMVLDAVEARVLGALVEKALTTPDYYPLTLNALVNACNQTSNRDPVTNYDQAAVKRALETLRDRKLAFVFEGAASRVTKFGHKFSGDARPFRSGGRGVVRPAPARPANRG